MGTEKIKLTKVDKLILDSYASMIEGLSAYLGSVYEISLHSIEDYNHSVIKIMNGYHSGRSAGAPLTDLALNMLKRVKDQGISASESYTSYNAISPSGERLKSSTIPILGKNGRVIGILCMNLYLDSPLTEVLQTIVGNQTEQTRQENFANSMGDTITHAVTDARNQVMHNPSIPAANKNKELIRILYGKGIFNMKDAIVLVADALGISRNTVYMHLRNMN